MGAGSTRDVNQVGTRRVAVIGTGGTIGGIAPSRTDFQTYKGGQLTAADLVDALRAEVGSLAELETTEFRGDSPPGLKLADYHDLTMLVDQYLEHCDAVVITTGTQLMEELAYWLDLTVRSPKPVVVTGSLRPWNVLGSDGPSNLYNALVLAAGGRTAGFGTVVLLNDEILAARDVTKTSTLRLNAFQSRQFGVLGTVDGGQVRLLRAPARVRLSGTPEWATPFDLTTIARADLPRVEIVYTYVDAGGEAIRAFVDGGARGVVVAGDPSIPQFEAIQHGVKQGLIVVAGNRNGSGAVYDTGVPGVVAAEDLLPQKSRLLLLLALARTDDVEQIASWFAEYGVPQF